MSNVFEMVEDFNVNLIGIDRIHPKPIEDASEMGFLVGCLREEIDELEEANGQDFIAEIDAIIDLTYFALGGLCRMGIPSSLQSRIFEVVHQANMTKVAGKKAARENPHDLDAIKPEDWEGPEVKIAELLDGFNANLNRFARTDAAPKE